MVSLGLVVAEAQRAPAALIVLVTLDDAVHERVAHALERLPLVLCDVQIREELVPAVAEEAPQLGARHALVVDERLVHAVPVPPFRPGLYRRELQPQPKVDGVLLGRFPLQDVVIRAVLVRGLDAREDEPVVPVLEIREHHVEEHVDAVAELHRLHDQVEGLERPFLGKLVEEVPVRFDDALLDVGDALVIAALREVLTVEHQAIEDEEAWHVLAIIFHVDHQLAVDDCPRVESLHVVLEREVRARVANVPEIIPSINQVYRLSSVFFCQV